MANWPAPPAKPFPLVARVSSTRRGADAPLALTYPPIPFLSPPDSGLPFDALFEAAKGRAGVRSRLPPMPAPCTPGMRLPTPKSFHPVMPDELSKWSSFFARLSAHHSFSDICQATRGRHKLTPLPLGVHPVASLHNTLCPGGAPMQFVPDTPAQDLEAALSYGCHRSATRNRHEPRSPTSTYLSMISLLCARALPKTCANPGATSFTCSTSSFIATAPAIDTARRPARSKNYALATRTGPPARSFSAGSLFCLPPVRALRKNPQPAR